MRAAGLPEVPEQTALVAAAAFPKGTLAGADAGEKTDTWQAKYALRTGVEGTINQALDVTDLRRALYRGLHAYSDTAINVIQLDAHWNDPPRRPRTSRLTRLAHQLAD